MGEWRETNMAWYKLQLVYCDLCGQIIPRRLWVATIDREEKTFCGEDCERLYRTYYLTEGAGLTGVTVHHRGTEAQRVHRE